MSLNNEGFENSDEEYDSLDEDNLEELFILNTYQPEEVSRTKYNIVICQLYNSKKHGEPYGNSGVEYHYLTDERFKLFDKRFIDYLISDYHDFNIENINRITPHNIFRNYKNIIERLNNIQPEIAECLYLSNGECVSIIKTFWIKIIQRKWKNIINERTYILKLRCHVKSILYRELNGRWPDYCLRYPSLKGMLS